MKAILPILFLASCNTTQQTVTVKSPDGTVTTTVTASKSVDRDALQSGAQIAGSAAALALGRYFGGK